MEGGVSLEWFVQQVTCKLLELDSRAHGAEAAMAGGGAVADLRVKLAAKESEATELRSAAAGHAAELKLAMSEAAELRMALADACARAEAQEADSAAAEDGAAAQLAESSKMQMQLHGMMEQMRALEQAREVAEADVVELSEKCEDLVRKYEEAQARCQEAEYRREAALDASRRHAADAAAAAERAEAAMDAERRLRARLQAAREGLRGGTHWNAEPAQLPAGREGGGEQLEGGEGLCAELSLSGERGLGAGRASPGSSRDGDTDASAWEEIMHARDAEVAALRADLAAARAAGAMLTDSAEEAEELRRRVEGLERELHAAAARRQVRGGGRITHV